MSPGGAAPRPLCVDLDGTLLLGDVGVEAALALLRRNPLYLLALLGWLLRGVAHAKRQVALRVQPASGRHLPWDERVLAWVRGERARRPCLLVTASDAHLVEPLAAHLGCFDAVLASDGRINLSGPHKAAALTRRYGHGGYAYAGNARADLPVWAAAGEVIVANAPPALLRRVRRHHPGARVFPRRGGGWRSWLRALRLHHWSKNFLVFAPLLGAHQLADAALLGRGALAWLLLGICVSGTYLLNDLLDLAADRAHPRKRRRPLAAGVLPLTRALAAAPALILLAFALALTTLPGAFSGWLAAYLGLTLAYSLGLKRLLLVDAAVLGVLFTLRILAGGAATGVAVSAWLLLLSLLLFFHLALLKRYVELRGLAARGSSRAAGRGYRSSHERLVAALGALSGAGTLGVLFAYGASTTGAALYARPGVLWLLAPLLGFWLARLWRLTRRGVMHEDPVVFATRDALSWFTLGAGAVIVWAAI